MSRLFLIWVLGVWALNGFPQEPPPWERAPFEADPLELVQAARALTPPEDESLDMLLKETKYVLGEDGAMTQTTRWAYRILTAEGVDEWSSTESSWSPWHQNRPEIRVRVSNPDGQAHWLDPSTIQEAGGEEQDRVYTDSRTLRAPFPAVTLDSIIEEEVVVSEHRPFFEEGFVYTWDLVGFQTRRMHRLILDVPEGREPILVTRPHRELTPKIEREKGRVRYTYELTNTPLFDGVESNLPPDQPRWAHLAFTTGRSWARVAERYASWVDRQLENEDFSWVPRDAVIKDDARATSLAFMAWLSKNVRYTGLAFGQSAIMPAKPSQSLARGFGDCKDKSTLLVGMLRSVGFEANVALLNASPGEDIHPELPGLGEFNHAIVVVRDATPFWVDPTGDFNREGALPLVNQGRWALIADKETRELSKTPEAPASDNWVRETRVYHLPDEGSGRGSVKLLHGGAMDASYRSDLDGLSPEDLKEGWQGFIEETFRNATIEDLSFSDPRDLSGPLEIKLSLSNLGRAVTEENEAVAAVMPSDLLDYFPDELKATGDENSRENAYLFWRPYFYEITYTIVPPEGFTLSHLPESVSKPIGAGKTNFEFRVDEDQRVTAVLQLDTGKRLLSPQEFKSYREDAAALLEQDGILVRFHHEGARLLEQGQYKQALAQFRKWTERSPEKPIHHTRYARALLQAGLGDLAREAAQTAVSKSPDSVEAHNTLGFILQHDLLGRYRHPGYDRAGAIAAYERAVVLDPDHFVSRADLAILMEFDENGFRYTSTTDIKQATPHYRYLIEKHEANLKENLQLNLALSGQFEELLSFLKAHESPENSHGYRILAITGLQGVEKGLQEAESIPDVDSRRKALAGTAELLVRLRQYQHAAWFLERAAQGADNAMDIEFRADMLKKAHEDVQQGKAGTGPERVVKQVVRGVVAADGRDFSALAPFFTPRCFALITDPEIEDNLEKAFAQIWHLATNSDADPRLLLEVGLAIADIRVEGDDDNGYRVELGVLGSNGETKEVYFLVHQEGAYRIVSANGLWGEVGLQAFRYLEAGNTPAFETWLSWAQEAYPFSQLSKRDPPALSDLWRKGDESDAERDRIAVAIAMAGFESSAELGISTLLEARKSQKDQKILDAIDFALAMALGEAGRFQEALPLNQRLIQAYPDSILTFLLLGQTLYELQKMEALNELFSQYEGKEGFAEALPGLRLRTQSVGSDFETYQETFMATESEGLWDAEDYNEFAWNALIHDQIDDRALSFIRKAVKLSNGEVSAIWHTLASLYAEQGRCKEARDALIQTMQKGGSLLPESSDWYVLGRIAEQYGYPSSARTAYEKVEKPKRKNELPRSTYFLAQRRLAAMDNP